jgi:hypothetical protein
MTDARGALAPTDCEIHPWILKHPFGIVFLRDDGFGIEQFSIEADRRPDVFYADMNMESLHPSPIA